MIVCVKPIKDIDEHDDLSSVCKCSPKVELQNGNILIIHKSFDNREIIEEFNEIIGSEPKKNQWIVTTNA